MEQLSEVVCFLWKVVSPVLILVGTAGNILCIVVMSQRATRRSSTGLYLTALAVSDLLVLYSGLLRWWLIYTFDTDLRTLSNGSCKTLWFLIFVSTEISSWVLVAVTLERAVSTQWPHKVKAVCTPRSAKVTLVTIVTVIMAANSHIFVGIELQTIQIETNDSGYRYNDSSTIAVTVCNTQRYSQYETFFYFAWPWVDFLLYYLVPFVILIFGNTVIIRKLFKSRRLHRASIGSNASVVSSGVSKISSRSQSITMMLLTVNTVFIVCTTPITVFLIGRPYWTDPDQGNSDIQQLVWTLVNLLMFLNHSVNFLLYFLSGSRFRKQVKELFRRTSSWRRDMSISVSELSARNAGREDATTADM